MDLDRLHWHSHLPPPALLEEYEHHVPERLQTRARRAGNRRHNRVERQRGVLEQLEKAVARGPDHRGGAASTERRSAQPHRKRIEEAPHRRLHSCLVPPRDWRQHHRVVARPHPLQPDMKRAEQRVEQRGPFTAR